MKFQYSTRTILLATAFAACVCGAYSVWWLFIKIMKAEDGIVFPIIFFIPFYLPAVFVGYAAGRRKLSIWLMLVFIVLQVTALGVAYFAMIKMNGP